MIRFRSLLFLSKRDHSIYFITHIILNCRMQWLVYYIFYHVHHTQLLHAMARLQTKEYTYSQLTKRDFYINTRWNF